jgi:hypothetical protein
MIALRRSLRLGLAILASVVLLLLTAGPVWARVGGGARTAAEAAVAAATGVTESRAS